MVAVRRDGRLVAIAPLQRTGGWDSRIRLINELDGSGFLYADDEALARLVDAVLALRRPLVLTSLVAGSPTDELMLRRRDHRHLRWARAWRMGPSLRLDETFVEPLSRLRSKSRSDIRRRLRRAEERGSVSFHIDPIGDDLDERYAEFVRIEACGWKGRAGSSLAQDASERETLRRFIAAPEIRDQVRIASMRMDGEVVAVNLVMICERRLWGIKEGYDESFSRYAPGVLLKLHLMSWAAKEGLERFELMGGMDRWKREWGRGRTLHHVRLYPTTLRGLMALSVDVTTAARPVVRSALDRVRRTMMRSVPGLSAPTRTTATAHGSGAPIDRS